MKRCKHPGCGSYALNLWKEGIDQGELCDVHYWKAQAMRFAAALMDVMDGTKDHDIQAETGLPLDDCDKIAETRKEARLLLKTPNPSFQRSLRR